MKNVKQDAVAEVCLYGARSCGFGWLGQMFDGQKFGDGELRFESASLAIANACQSIPTSLARTDVVLIFDMGGQRVARTNAWGPQTYGDLDWKDAPQFVISAADLIAESNRQASLAANAKRDAAAKDALDAMKDDGSAAMIALRPKRQDGDGIIPSHLMLGRFATNALGVGGAFGVSCDHGEGTPTSFIGTVIGEGNAAAVAAVPDMVRALGVIVNDPAIWKLLNVADPMAARQVLAAFKMATGKGGA